MKLKHKFGYRTSTQDRTILAQSGTLSKFTRNLCTIAEKQDPSKYKPNACKGDGFEWFAEYFFKTFSSDNLFLRISEYEVWQQSWGSDYGIDGMGVYVPDNTKKVAIQVKFRENQSKYLSSKEDDLSNLSAKAGSQFGIETKKEYLVVFTNVSGVARTTLDGIYGGELRVINKEIISRYVDNNESFWRGFEGCVA